MPVAPQPSRKVVSDANLNPRQLATWEPPPAGWTALNSDGSYAENDGTAGAGMVLPDPAGAIIYSSCRELRQCSSPLQSELAACVEGLNIAIQWSDVPIIVQTDCVQAVKLITSSVENRSANLMLVQEIKEILNGDREILVNHVRREQNSVSHFLANFGRIKKRTAVWLHSVPDEVHTLCNADIAVA